MLDLPFFYLQDESGTLEVSPQFWKYFAISVPLATMTLGYWKISMWRKKKERARRFSEERKGEV